MVLSPGCRGRPLCAEPGLHHHYERRPAESTDGARTSMESPARPLEALDDPLVRAASESPLEETPGCPDGDAEDEHQDAADDTGDGECDGDHDTADEARSAHDSRPAAFVLVERPCRGVGDG